MIKIIQIVERHNNELWALADNGSVWIWGGNTWQLESEGLPPADSIDPGEPSTQSTGDGDDNKVALNISFK